VSPHIYDYFLCNWNVSNTDRDVLEDYREARKHLGWDMISELLEWAYNDFPFQETYSKLKTSIDYFERRKDNEGKMLKQHINSILPALNDGVTYIDKELKQRDISIVFLHFKKLFRAKDIKRAIPIYVLYSFKENSTSGNADGDSICIEIPSNKDYIRSYQILIHEYAHKFLNPSCYFENHSSPSFKELSKKQYDNIYSGKLSNYFEEAIIYALCDINLFHIDPDKKVSDLRTATLWDNATRERVIHIWNLAKKVQPLLKTYLKKNKPVDITIEQLEKVMSDYVNGNRNN
jgi:hypothetical protein